MRVVIDLGHAGEWRNRAPAPTGYDAAVKLSIPMPVYNESATLQSSVKRVLDVKIRSTSSW